MSIEIKNLEYIYMPRTPFERVALKNINLEIEKKSFTAIVGHTGSGKSTLVQHFNGLLAPSAGSILVDGCNINEKSAQAKLARRKIGMVFQYPEHQLFEETVYADIAFGPKNLGLSEEEIELSVKKAMQFVQLDYETYKDRSPFQLSGGQMRRVAIAGVIALNPEYLILDEPTAGLDPRARTQLLSRIAALHREGIGIVMVSHNMDDVAKLADQVIFMKQGEVTLQADPQIAFSAYEKLKEAGLEVPQITSLLQTLKNHGMSVHTDVFSFDQAVRDVYKAIKDRGGKSC